MATMTVRNAAGLDETVEKPLAPGQATMAGSRPVVIASNQSAIPVSGSFWQAIQPVTGTVAISGTIPVSAASMPLAAGAATSAMQSVANIALGAPADAAWTKGNGSVVALLKSLATAANIEPSLRASNPPSWTAPIVSTTSATVLAANLKRKSAVIRNHGDMPLLLDLSGGTASAQRFQVCVPSRTTYELSNGYTGPITGIFESGIGAVEIVEFS